MNTGWESRLKKLRRDAEDKILSKLAIHSWKSRIIKEVPKGDYIVIEASRCGFTHKVALMYSSATSNDIYKSLESQVDHIFINEELYKLESFTYGITTPISKAADFQHILLDWNSKSTDGLFVPTLEEDAMQGSLEQHKGVVYNRIQSENPLQTVWIHLRQLESVTLAKKNISRRASTDSVKLTDDVVNSKGEGLAFALRNASDYFKSADNRNISQRILNLYYGTLAFSFAEMLASPEGSDTLVEIEGATKQGHGLYTIDGKSEKLEDLIIGVIKNGFFSKYMGFLGLDTQSFSAKKPRKYGDLGLKDSSWTTFENLISRIPDIGDLFVNIFDSKPGWIIPNYDSEANRMDYRTSLGKPSRSYVILTDRSGRWEKEDIVNLKEAITEISKVSNKEERGGKSFRGCVDHEGYQNFWSALSLHSSPYINHAVIVPLFGSVKQFRAITLVILYALSIVVRYRPSLWRRVQEGDLDYMRVLIEAYLDVVERVLPEQYLGQITGQTVVTKQPGTLF